MWDCFLVSLRTSNRIFNLLSAAIPKEQYRMIKSSGLFHKVGDKLCSRKIWFEFFRMKFTA